MLPMKLSSVASTSRACASTTAAGPFAASLPFDSSATRGRRFGDTSFAYAVPISANATRSSGVASIDAPTSRISENGSSRSPRRSSVG